MIEVILWNESEIVDTLLFDEVEEVNDYLQGVKKGINNVTDVSINDGEYMEVFKM